MLNHEWGLTREAFGGGDHPNGLGAVAASEGLDPTIVAVVGRCRGLRRPVFGVRSKISMSSQDDLGQGPACSALAMDPQPLEARGRSPLTSICLGSIANTEHAPNHPD